MILPPPCFTMSVFAFYTKCSNFFVPRPKSSLLFPSDPRVPFVIQPTPSQTGFNIAFKYNSCILFPNNDFLYTILPSIGIVFVESPCYVCPMNRRSLLLLLSYPQMKCSCLRVLVQHTKTIPAWHVRFKSQCSDGGDVSPGSGVRAEPGNVRATALATG